MMIGRRAEVLPGRVRRPRLPRRQRLEGVPGDGRRVRHRAAGRTARGDRLPEPIFTPADEGAPGRARREHPVRAGRSSSIGPTSSRPASARSRSPLYERGAAIAERAGIILADTKFEFGVAPGRGADAHRRGADARLVALLGRRRVRARPGRRPSYDKQFVRDWLEAQPWDKTAPGPALPADIVAGTRARYVEAFERITGASFDRYLAGGRRSPDEQRRIPLRRQRHAQARDPRSAGQGRRTQPAAPGRRRRVRRARRSAGRAHGRGGRRGGGAGDRRTAGGRAAEQPADRAVRGRVARAECAARPPGRRGDPGSASSCSRARTGTSTRVNGLRLAGAEPRDPVARGRRPRRRRRRGAARRLRLRRLPSSRRHRAVLARSCARCRVRGARRARARDLQRLPGAGRGRARARRAVAQSRPAIRVPLDRASRRNGSTRRSRRCVPEASTAADAVAHGEGCYFADDATLDELERAGQVLFRYVTRTGSPAPEGDRAIPTARSARSPA